MTFQLHKSGKKISAKFSVLGLNLSNNGSVCVMRDGVLDFYLESERITRKKRDHAVRSLIKYIDDMQKKAKQMRFVKDLKKEVNINANGSSKYKIKEGPNKGKVV